MACHTCRACLYKVEPSEATSIFSLCSDGGVISDILKEIAPVEIARDDAFSKVICSGCLQRLKDFCEFRTVIVKSDKKLREMQTRPIAFNTKCLKQKLNHKLRGEQPKNIEYVDEEVDKECITEIKVEGYPLEFLKIERSEPNVVLSDIESSSTNLPETDPLENKQCETNSPRRKLGGRKRTVVNGETVPVQNKTVRRRKPHVCSECGRHYVSKKNLDLHIAHRHTGGEMPHICDVCGKGYPHGYMLKIHKLNHSDEKNYKCRVEGCGKAFRFPGTLTVHHKGHLGIKSYKCDVCGKSFTQVGGLQAHKRVHNGEKTICEICGKAYSAIGPHMEVHNKPPPIPCPICGKSYKGKKSLKTHMETHVDKEEKGIECEICKKKFAHRCTLIAHKRVHEGVKPYTCKICNKSFRQSSVLWKHQRVHTLETPFHCTFCPRKFGYKHHMKSHIVKAHQESPH